MAKKWDPEAKFLSQIVLRNRGATQQVLWVGIAMILETKTCSCPPWAKNAQGAQQHRKGNLECHNIGPVGQTDSERVPDDTKWVRRGDPRGQTDSQRQRVYNWAPPIGRQVIPKGDPKNATTIPSTLFLISSFTKSVLWSLSQPWVRRAVQLMENRTITGHSHQTKLHQHLVRISAFWHILGNCLGR